MQLSFCPCLCFKTPHKKLVQLKILPLPLSSSYLTASGNTAVHHAWGPSHTWLLDRHILVSWKRSSSVATFAYLAFCEVLEEVFAHRADWQAPETHWDSHESLYTCLGTPVTTWIFIGRGHRFPPSFTILGSVSLVFLAK